MNPKTGGSPLDMPRTLQAARDAAATLEHELSSLRDNQDRTIAELHHGAQELADLRIGVRALSRKHLRGRLVVSTFMTAAALVTFLCVLGGR